MQDGYYDTSYKSIILCTEGFTKEECILLQQVLKNFSIESGLKVRNKERDTYRLRIKKKSIPTVENLVQDKIPEIFRYKLGPKPAATSAEPNNKNIN